MELRAHYTHQQNKSILKMKNEAMMQNQGQVYSKLIQTFCQRTVKTMQQIEEIVNNAASIKMQDPNDLSYLKLKLLQNNACIEGTQERLVVAD